MWAETTTVVQTSQAGGLRTYYANWDAGVMMYDDGWGGGYGA